jgi:hypothetical protein
MPKQTPIIKQDDPAMAPELLASHIEEVADAAHALLNSRLSKRAILILIRDQTVPAVSLGDIDRVLSAAANLKKAYVKS